MLVWCKDVKIHTTIEYTDDGLAELLVKLFSELFPGLSPLPPKNALNFMAETIRVQRFELAAARGEPPVSLFEMPVAGGELKLQRRGL